MMNDQISENAKAILLLCGRFGSGDDGVARPLTSKEYDGIESWLRKKEWLPEDLLEESNIEALKDPGLSVEFERIRSLLSRGVAMAFAIEKWSNKGLWVLCRGDQEYPERLMIKLKGNAPPILHGVGDQALLSKGGLAVVGSRNVDAQGESFARDLGKRAAECRMQLVSGAARGVDELAMHGAFLAGGTVVGVMADSLLSSAVSGKYREGLRDGNLALVSAFNPEAGFNVGNAMGRNKYIYAFADFAVVVSADYGKGGTWTGAEEELRSKDRHPVFVRIGTDVPRGNMELLKKGAISFPEEAWKEDLANALGVSAASGRPGAQEQSLLLEFSQGQPSARKGLDVLPAVHEVSAEYGPEKGPKSTAIYDVIKPIILAELKHSMNIDELGATINVRKPQLQDWIKTLIAEGLVKQRTILKRKKLIRVDRNEELGF
jgi:predicted Rossmann fold nucleotide-binding protein DprA/Smf involved in DNA uptake